MKRMPMSEARHPRGSTMILVVSILVLLVILATAFVSRTQASRATASAQQQVAAQTDRIGPIAHAVTEEIAQSLFVKPVDVTDPTLILSSASSAYPRLAPTMDTPVNGSTFIPGAQTRYGVDPLDRLNNSTLALAPDGIVDGYNYAPYEVRPWTNWPDAYNASPAGDIRTAEANPVGNPGFGDTRWLRSTEPERVVYQGQPAFSHWAHLSWIPTANNGWRLVTDISNVTAKTLTQVAPTTPANFFPATPVRYGLQIPYEQWLPSVPPDPTLWVPTTIGAVPAAPAGPFPNPSSPQGDAALVFQQLAFGTAPAGNPAGGWFSTEHPTALANPSLALPNFLRLKWFGPKGDEFITDSPRNIITRTLCDTDGDGFTDSFWFLAPTSLDRSIRHLVGVSVVDNCALLNVNIASRMDNATTAGTTPADLALVGRLDSAAVNAQVPAGDPAYQVRPRETGYLSSPLNTASASAYSGVTVNFDPNRFGSPTTTAAIPGGADDPTFLRELGVVKETGTTSAVVNPAFPTFLKSDLERIRYFKAMSNSGEVDGYFNSATPPVAVLRTAGRAPEVLDPFTMADELELRAFTGHNNPYLRSRLERALETDAANTSFQPLRSAMVREETSEYFDQLDARQLLFDNRRKITTVSGARNEMMPPWLWTLPPAPVPPGSSAPWAVGQVRSWQPLYATAYGPLDVSSPRSVPPQGTPDLALQFPAQPGALAGDANCDTVIDQTDVELARSQFLAWNRKVDLNRELFVDIPNAQQLVAAQHDYARDVMKVLQRSMLDVDTRTSVFGNEVSDLDKAMRACASWTANILAARDGPRLGSSAINIPTDPPLHPDRGIIIPENPALSFIGQEKHPFIVQAFFAVVYPKTGTIPQGVPGAGASYVCYDQTNGDPARIVLAVQIANPYNEPIALWPFQLRAFGQMFQFFQPPSGTDGRWGYGVEPMLGPATEEGPRSAIVFAIPKSMPGDTAFRARMMNALDLTHPWLRTGATTPAGAIVPTRMQNELAAIPASEVFPPGGLNTGDLFEDINTLYPDTLVFNASKVSGAEPVTDAGANKWDLHPKFYLDKLNSSNPEDSDIAIVRLVSDPYNPSSSASIVVDRLENEFAFASQAGTTSANDHPWREALLRVLTPPPDGGGGGAVGAGSTYMVPPKYVAPDPGSQTQQFAHVDIGGDDFMMTWARISRPWTVDVDGNKSITADERSPRFVFAANSKPVVSKVTKGSPTYVGLIAGDTYDMPAVGFTKDELKTKPDALVTITAKTPMGDSARGKPTNFTLRTILVGSDRQYPAWDLGPTGGWPGTPGAGASPTSIYGDTGAGVPKRTLDFYSSPLRMEQRDGPFEQIAEVFDVPVWGPVMQQLPSGAWQTLATYGEMMVGQRDAATGHRKGNDDTSVRFPTFDATGFDERETMRFLNDRSRSAVLSVVGFVPPLPAGASILDGFTLDGAGMPSIDSNLDGTTTNEERLAAEQRRLRLASGFGTGGTKGLINVNTAPIEVMRAMPHMQQLTYNTDPLPHLPPGTVADPDPSGNSVATQNYVRVPESIVNYRERYPAVNGFPGGPKYDDRGFVPATGTTELFPFHPGMRGERGIVSVGELSLLDREFRPSNAGTAQEPDPEALANGVWNEDKSWSIAFAGRDPYRTSEDPPIPAATGTTGHPPAVVPPPSDTGSGWHAPASGGGFASRLSTERLGNTLVQTDFLSTPAVEPTIYARNLVGGDQVERNALLKGIANIVTTRSDVFTVYLKVRTVAQDPATGNWDGTNPATLIEESRFVMVVDRTGVDRPGQQPKILMFEKIFE